MNINSLLFSGLGGNTRYYHYIYGDNGVVALHIANATAGTDSMYYIHTDHLGSYCALTNTSKEVRQRNYFDPWGNFRLSGELVSTESSEEEDTPIGSESLARITEGGGTPSFNFCLTHRGFTGHEHSLLVGLTKDVRVSILQYNFVQS